jgi:hypothetical protein
MLIKQATNNAIVKRYRASQLQTLHATANRFLRKICALRKE